VVPQGFVVLFPVVLGGDFWSPLLVVFSLCFRDLALGDFMGEIRVNLRGSFAFDFPPKFVSSGARFWGFEFFVFLR
jgi:hypothetical protein